MKTLNTVLPCWILIILILLVVQPAFGALKWKETKGKHFVVYSVGERIDSKQVLDKAEGYFKEITENVGYVRYSNFWLWEERTSIYIYPNRETYYFYTRLPGWSCGASVYENNGRDKKIVSYELGEEFIDSILPHEISHLILSEFVGRRKAPLWLQEGVAQFQEKNSQDKNLTAREFLKQYLHDGVISLNNMAGIFPETKEKTQGYYNFAKEKEVRNDQVRLFYTRSLNLVSFMINEYGQKSFSVFCKQLRDGKTMEEALRYAYPTRLRNVNQLEEQWQENIAR